MQLKDIVSLLISILAFVLSFIVTIYTIVVGILDKKRTIRTQLTDVFNKMFDANLESIKQNIDLLDKDQYYIQSVNQQFSQQFAALLEQAMYLANQIAKDVTTIEYNTLAAANAGIQQYALANTYARKSIEVCPPKDLYYQALATRGYASMLFPQGNIKEGRVQFDSALKLLAKSNIDKNLLHYTNGMTNQQWATYESYFAVADNKTEALLDEAKKEYEQIDIQFVKQNALANLGVLPLFQNMQHPHGRLSMQLPSVSQGLPTNPNLFAKQQSPDEVTDKNQAVPPLPDMFSMFAKQQPPDQTTP